MLIIINLVAAVVAIILIFKALKMLKDPSTNTTKVVNPQSDWQDKYAHAKKVKNEVCRMNPQFQDLNFIYALDHAVNPVVLTDRGILLTKHKTLIPYQSIKSYRFEKSMRSQQMNDGTSRSTESVHFKRFVFDWMDNDGQMRNGANFEIRTEELSIFTDIIMTILRQVQN